MAEDKSFEAWKKEHGVKESSDYDTYAAFKAGVEPDERGHLPDDYKLPNHITYSEESIHAKGKDAPPAGKWVGSDKDGWEFHANTTNILNAGGVEKLKQYFAEKEPDAKLVLPLAYKQPTELPKKYREGGRVRMI